MRKKYLSSGARLGGVVAALAAAGGAFAYFTSVGSGQNSTVAGTVQPVVIAPATAGEGLYPGGAGDVAFTVSNPNLIAVHVTSFELDSSRGTGGVAVDSGHAACTRPALSFTRQDNGGAGWSVPANGLLSLDLTDAVAMGADADSGCQGATFTVYLSAGS